MGSRHAGRLLATTVLMVSTCVALAACTETESSIGAPQPALKPVKVLEVQKQPSVERRSFPSVLQPPQITPLSFDVGGRLGAVDLQIGQVVPAGTTLMRVEERDYALRLQQAESALAEAQSALVIAKDEEERQATLYNKKLVSRSRYQQAKLALDQANSRFDQAQTNLELTAASKTDTTLTAPFDAIVNSVEVQSYQSVQQGVPVVTLYRSGQLQAQILVSYETVSKLQMGVAVEIIPANSPGQTLAGRITEIARRAPAVSSFPVVVTIDDVPEYLRSGMAVDVEIILSNRPDAPAISLPISALATQYVASLEVVAQGEQRLGSVFVLDEEASTLSLREVGISGIRDERMTIASGLAAGELVVTAGTTFLFDGQAATRWTGGGDEK